MASFAPSRPRARYKVKIRFFLDEDVHAELSHALRNRGFDVLHAQELYKAP